VPTPTIQNTTARPDPDPPSQPSPDDYPEPAGPTQSDMPPQPTTTTTLAHPLQADPTSPSRPILHRTTHTRPTNPKENQ